jgi:hypothetical protein
MVILLVILLVILQRLLKVSQGSGLAMNWRLGNCIKKTGVSLVGET